MIYLFLEGLSLNPSNTFIMILLFYLDAVSFVHYAMYFGIFYRLNVLKASPENKYLISLCTFLFYTHRLIINWEVCMRPVLEKVLSAIVYLSLEFASEFFNKTEKTKVHIDLLEYVFTTTFFCFSIIICVGIHYVSLLLLSFWPGKNNWASRKGKEKNKKFIALEIFLPNLEENILHKSQFSCCCTSVLQYASYLKKSVKEMFISKASDWNRVLLFLDFYFGSHICS